MGVEKMTDNMKKLEELLKDENLAKEVLFIKEPEAAQAWLSDHGVDLSMDEIMTIGEILNKFTIGEITPEQLQKAADGELSEEELELVAGGESMDELVDDPGFWIVVGTAAVITIGAIGIACFSW